MPFRILGLAVRSTGWLIRPQETDKRAPARLHIVEGVARTAISRMRVTS
jgi:hypothetical protein